METMPNSPATHFIGFLQSYLNQVSSKPLKLEIAHLSEREFSYNEEDEQGNIQDHLDGTFIGQVSITGSDRTPINEETIMALYNLFASSQFGPLEEYLQNTYDANAITKYMDPSPSRHFATAMHLSAGLSEEGFPNIFISLVISDTMVHISYTITEI